MVLKYRRQTELFIVHLQFNNVQTIGITSSHTIHSNNVTKENYLSHIIIMYNAFRIITN